VRCTNSFNRRQSEKYQVDRLVLKTMEANRRMREYQAGKPHCFANALRTTRSTLAHQRWIGFPEDDGSWFAEGAIYQAGKPHA
jgi:hypothetical protein